MTIPEQAVERDAKFEAKLTDPEYAKGAAISWRRHALRLQQEKASLAAALVGVEQTWQPIETAPLGDDDFYLVCCNDPADDRSPFVVRGSIFKSARTHPPTHHLSMAYLTHWQPLPAKPAFVADKSEVKS